MSLRYDLTDLRLFVNTVDAGSITAGAEATHLALASASARLQKLEEATEVPLLLRSRRGVQATPAGDVLLQHARALLLQTEQLRLALHQQARSFEGQVRLVGNSAAVREYVPDVLGGFLARHPAVNVVLDELLAADAVQAVCSGAADIAIVTELTDLAGLHARAFRRATFALVTPRGHPLAQAAAQGPLTMEQADAADIVGLSEGSPLQDAWERRAAQRGARLNYRVRVGSFDAQVRLIERGVGVSLMPEASARRLARLQNVEVIPMPDAFLNRQLLLCTRADAELPVNARALVEALCAGAGA
jgi:DNA-binding transcriptional LysR family regulator